MNINIKDILWTLFLLVILFGFLGGLYQIDKRSKEKERELTQFVNNCFNSGGEIQEIGDIFFGERLICNPK